MKMKPLSTAQRMWSWFCVCPVDEAINYQKVLFSVFVIVTNCFGLLTSATFFLKFISVDLQKSLFTIFQNSATFSAFYMTFIVIFSRHQIATLFQSLSKIYDENANDDDSSEFLLQTNDKCERIWKFYIKYVLTGFIIYTPLPSIVSTLIGWKFNGNFDSKYLYRSYKLLLPWDQHTLIGYYGELCFEILCVETYLFATGLMFLLFISICWHHQAFYKIFQHSAAKLDHLDKDRNNAAFLTNLIRFHNSVKSFFLETANVFSPYILIQLICSAVILSCTIFELDLQMKNIDFDIFIVLVATSVGASNLFLWCFFGKVATESFEKMADTLYERNWHNLPIKLQKNVVLMIQNAQKPLYYHGFGVAVLNLITFTKFLRTVFTYYMMFKTSTIN